MKKHLPRFGLVHRIDKNTSGLMVLAKTEKAVASLAKQFFDHTVKRQYMALAWGDIAERNGYDQGAYRAGTNVSENYLMPIRMGNMAKKPSHIIKYWNDLAM